MRPTGIRSPSGSGVVGAGVGPMGVGAIVGCLVGMDVGAGVGSTTGDGGMVVPSETTIISTCAWFGGIVEKKRRLGK